MDSTSIKKQKILDERLEGDGAPESDYPHNEENQIMKRNSKPFSFHLEIDLMQILLFLTGLVTRTWQIGQPRAVVFDELHYAKFVSLYLKKMFFFDVHPPLGKLLLTLAGHYTGFKGDINYDRIGTEYPTSMPVAQLRLVPAIMGSLLIPVVYQIAVELGLSRWAALIAGSFILLDNAMLVQSRFMLMESILLFFMAFAILSFLKFRRLENREFSLSWWIWMFFTGISFTCALSTKYVGIFTALLILFLVAKDYWTMVADRSKSDMCLIKHLLARILGLIIIPVGIYIGAFYVHLSLLTKAGPHDTVMTSAFQASLEGGLAALTKGQPLIVAYGSQMTLRHTHNLVPGRPCWLHSHPHVYPIKYANGRGSSHQQQVSCYIFKDLNNWWIIKDPKSDALTVDEPPRPVKHGDVVQLVHGFTGRILNSHDVAAPLSPQNQEVSCYIDYNISMASQNLWKVEIANRESNDETWQTIKSLVRLIHVNTTQALKVSGKQLPEWGFHQLEVVTDRVINQVNTLWNVEEHRYTKAKEKEDQAREISEAEMIPLEPTHLSFWSKLWELQLKMIFSRHDAELEHKYSSDPVEWPFMEKNIAYWISQENNAQIHLLGNLVIWYIGTIALLIYIGFFLFYVLRRHRTCFDLGEGEWDHFVFVGEVLISGYLLHYVPHFLTDRTLFLHHYLPALMFKMMVFAALIDHVIMVSRRIPYLCLVLYCTAFGLVSAAFWAFLELSAFSYGTTPLTPEDIKKLTWVDSWDFLIHVKIQ